MMVDVAVKKLDKLLQDSDKEFQTEMSVIGQTHHRNLVRLLGYCNEGQHRILVYELMSNGTLASFIFTSLKPNWNQRFQIVLGIARGLVYLHEGCCTQIIHCDIKPQNILLDDHYNARISDFGLAKLLLINQSHTETGIRGTKGYVAPDWFRSAPITAKVDTYSFGVLLLEIICCRKNVEKEFVNEEQGILTDWAYDFYKTKRLDNLLENDNEVGNDMMSLEKLVMIVIWCIQEDPSLRPTMKEVLLMLEGIVEVVVPRSPYLYGSVSIDSDTYSDTINSKKTQKAIRVMEILEKHSQADVFAYEALLNGYCKADIVDAANKECLCTMGVLFNYYCTLLCNFHFIRFVNHPNFVQVTATDVVIGEATVIVIGNNVTILYDASKVFDEISDRTLILKVSGLLRGGLNIGEVGCPPDAISYNNNYANVQLILEIAEITHVDAVWPGWGHASENPELPDALKAKGIVFLGPPAVSMGALGDKIGSSLIAQVANVPTLPWSGSHVKIPPESSLITIPDEIYRAACVYTTEEAIASCQVVGYPAMIKASWGGGGKGIRKVHNDDEVRALFKQVQGEVPGSPIFIMKVASQLYTAVIAVFNEGIKRYENFLLLVTTPNCHDGMNLGNDIINHLEQIIEEGPITVGPPETVKHGGGNDAWRKTSFLATPFDFDKAQSTKPKGHCVAVRVTSEDPDDGFKPTGGKVQELSFKSKPNVWAYFSVKVDVNGPFTTPVYQFLKSSSGGFFGDLVKWNLN
ncbi:hypothetical protein RYX36_000299 [Vicia faba]